MRQILAMPWDEQIAVLREVPLAINFREEWVKAHGYPIEWCTLGQVEILDNAVMYRDKWLLLHREKLLGLFCAGDQYGAPWEGGLPGLYTHRTWDEVKARRSPVGTDETAIVAMWSEFSKGEDITCSGWLDHLRLHHKEFHGWGNTMSDMLSLLRYSNKHVLAGDIEQQVRQIAVERRSYGNACLAMVLPTYCTALEHGLPAREFVLAYVTLAYTHDRAINACNQLMDIIEGRHPWRMQWEDSIALDMSAFVQRYPTNIPADETLRHAVWCAVNGVSGEDVVMNAVQIAGDTDSVLSTALLIKGLMAERDPESVVVN